MNESKYDDNWLESQATEKLSDDLQTLFEPEQVDWSVTDRVVMDRTAQHLLVRGRRRHWFYWPAAAAAAAAIVAGVLFTSLWNDKPTRTLPTAAILEDVDQNGHVDILDAFQLARMVESTHQPDIRWDMNADGIVNRQDVDIVANAAVNLRKGVL